MVEQQLLLVLLEHLFLSHLQQFLLLLLLEKLHQYYTTLLINKVVIAYGDSGNSFPGTAIVGTVSGTSITFGTPVVFESG